MTLATLCGFISIGLMLFLLFGGAMFALGRQGHRIDGAEEACMINAGVTTALGARINGSLKDIDRRLEYGNRELGGLTEAVNTLKQQQSELTKQFNSLNAIVAEVCGTLDKD